VEHIMSAEETLFYLILAAIGVVIFLIVYLLIPKPREKT